MGLGVLAAGVIYGTVTIGPLTPVCRDGMQCSGPAKNATLTFARAGKKPVLTHTDSAGHYRVKLLDGRWTVHVSVGMGSTPATVTVRAGTHRADLSVDTGLR